MQGYFHSRPMTKERTNTGKKKYHKELNVSQTRHVRILFRLTTI